MSDTSQTSSESEVEPLQILSNTTPEEIEVLKTLHADPESPLMELPFQSSRKWQANLVVHEDGSNLNAEPVSEPIQETPTKFVEEPRVQEPPVQEPHVQEQGDDFEPEEFEVKRNVEEPGEDQTENPSQKAALQMMLRQSLQDILRQEISSVFHTVDTLTDEFKASQVKLDTEIQKNEKRHKACLKKIEDVSQSSIYSSWRLHLCSGIFWIGVGIAGILIGKQTRRT